MKRALVAIALIAPALAFLPKQGTTPQPPVITPRITELGTILDTTPRLAMMPDEAALSPRGNLIAYQADEGLRIWNATTRTANVVLNSPVGFGNATWSPAGDAIVFVRSDEQGQASYIWKQRVDANTGRVIGTPQRVSLSTTTGYFPQFSPDGKSIAFPRSGEGKRSSLVVVPADGGPEKVLATEIGVRGMRWNTDGSALYFVSTDSSWLNPRVHRVPAAGGTPTLVYDAAGGEPPVIKADGRLAFDMHLANGDAIALKDSRGTLLATLSLPPNTWVADYSCAYKCAAVREEHPRGLRVTDLTNGSSRFVIDTTAEVGPPVWFPDGKRLAVLAKFGGPTQLVTMNPDGSGMRKYALAAHPLMPRYLLGYFQADLKISPDARYAMYLNSNRDELELVDLSTGAARTLVRSRISVSTGIWSSDSRTIRYVRDGGVSTPNSSRAVHEISIEGVDKQIRALPFSEFPNGAVPLFDFHTIASFGVRASDYKLVPLDGRPPRVLVPEPAWGGQLSPDGQMMALRIGMATNQSAPQRQISFVSLANGARRDVNLPIPTHPGSFQQFHPDGKSIFVAGRESSASPVIFYSVPVDGSTPREVARTDTEDAISTFSVSPDAKYIAYTVGVTPRFTFLTLDYTAGLSRLTPAPGNR